MAKRSRAFYFEFDCFNLLLQQFCYLGTVVERLSFSEIISQTLWALSGILFHK